MVEISFFKEIKKKLPRIIKPGKFKKSYTKRFKNKLTV